MMRDYDAESPGEDVPDPIGGSVQDYAVSTSRFGAGTYASNR